MPPAGVQAALRQAFARWGRPAAIRVDNGGPWGSSGGDLPPELALWLIGLGLDVRWNDPRSPRQNGVVERSQGTARRWGEPWRWDTAAALQRRLRQLDQLQREAYPYRDGQSRLQVYPGLASSGRPYRPAWERRHWDHARVLAHLAGYALRRRVDTNGKVWLYHRPHYVGWTHRRKDIFVMLDPIRVEWVFADDQGRQLRSAPAEELKARRIRGLTVSRREGSAE